MQACAHPGQRVLGAGCDTGVLALLIEHSLRARKG
jgi:hypothetical protein